MDRSMFKTAIEMFLGEQLIDVVRREDEDVIEFITITGNQGTVTHNFNGNLDIWIGEEVVYEMENTLEPLLEHASNDELLNLYEYSKKIDAEALKYKSRQFLNIVRGSIENILLNGRLPLDGRAVIGEWEVIYTNNRKFLISLN